MHTNYPFRGSRAVREGALTRHHLTRDFRRLHRDVYVGRDVAVCAVVRAHAAHVFASGPAVSCGLSAAALHGAKWIDPTEPAELVWTGRRRQLPDLRIRYDTLCASETTRVQGLDVTTVARTMFDLARRLPRMRAVQLLDSLSNATGFDPAQLQAVVDRYSGTSGVALARTVLPLVDGGSESPQESATRILLMDAGLPRPETQIRIVDESGRVFARCDLGWSRWKVVVEYDGVHHWTSEKQRTWDIERYDMLERAGWRVIRVNSEQLRVRPHVVAERVREKLVAAGAPI